VDAATQALLERYLRAWETQDVAGLVALMKEDATFTMPPSPSWYRGREAIHVVLTVQALHQRHRIGGTSPPQGPMGARHLPSITLLDRAVPFGPSGFKLSPWTLAHQACS